MAHNALTPDEQFTAVDFETDGDVHHVYPLFGREHDTSGEKMCWCYPVIEHHPGGIVVTHSAEH